MSEMSLIEWQNLLAALQTIIKSYGLAAVIEAIEYLKIARDNR